ncbi:MAG: hypothetical protein JXA91_07690 [Candidatus Thermoplasmatota archaeon]|nr:hypothetical protein [Candidatus Thermoplasmatota archaeon]
MKIKLIKNKYLFFEKDNTPENKYRPELSKIIIEKIGMKNDYLESEILNTLSLSFTYYTEKFELLCKNTKDYFFYLLVLDLHENITDYSIKNANQILIPDIDKNYVPLYRRILKCILECACDVNLITETPKLELEAYFPLLNDLLFIGEMMFTVSVLFAENSMMKDSIDIKFDSEELLQFTRKPHYNSVFKFIKDITNTHYDSVTNDQIAVQELLIKINECFKFDYANLGELLALIYEHNANAKKKYFGISFDDILNNFRAIYKYCPNELKTFLNGLILSRNNKLPLSTLVSKPYHVNRYLCRPLLIWNIDGIDKVHFGLGSWTEALIQITTNCIPYGKAPIEWLTISIFKEFMHKCEDKHDKVLENALENSIREFQIDFDRNVKKLWTGTEYLSFNIKELGEIDFIIVSHELKKIFILDCKNLTAKYDSVGQRNDYSAFVLGKKPYNETLEKKVNWFNENKHHIETHFNKIRFNNRIPICEYEIEGIFVIDTPTLYMYNSKFRIYTVEQFHKVLDKTYSDTIIYSIDKNGNDCILTYPYFSIPEYSEKFAILD